MPISFILTNREIAVNVAMLGLNSVLYLRQRTMPTLDEITTY